MPGWRFAAAVTALAAYALLSHWLMLNAVNRPWAVAALFGPMVLGIATLAWQRKQRITLGACAALVVLLTVVVARGGVSDIQRMYVLQHAGIHLALAWSFLLTLRAGATPMITTVAEQVHRRLHQVFTPAMRAYSRWVTMLWAGYFLGMVVVSVAIYTLAPWAWWSLFGNVLTPMAAGLLFLAEHVMRYRRHPDFERITLRAAFEAYQRSSATRPGP